MKVHGLYTLAALGATCYAQLAYTNQLSTDLTIALVANGQDCDASNAPSLHITGFPNTTGACIAVNLWSDKSYSLNNPGGSVNISYTVANAEHYSNTTSYSNFWYQQLSKDSTQNQGNSTVGTLLVKTFPCPNCAMTCEDEGTGSESSPAFSDSLPAQHWLQWDCFAEGTCYPAPYDIKGFWVQTSVDKFDKLDAAEQNNKCELAAVTSANATNNNNTSIDDENTGAVSSHSMLAVWTITGLVASILVFT